MSEIKPAPLSPEQREEIEKRNREEAAPEFYVAPHIGAYVTKQAIADRQALLAHLAYLEEENARLREGLANLRSDTSTNLAALQRAEGRG